MSPRTQAILIGGAFIGVMSALPVISIANCCCLWVIGGGIVTAYLLQQDAGGNLPVGDGALGGLLAGVAGAFLYGAVSGVIQLITAPLRPDTGLLDIPADLPPAVIEMFETFVATPSLAIMIGFVVMLFVGVPFATLGGVLGTLFFRREQPATAGGDIVPPPPHD